MTDIPSSEPAELRAGDTCKWTRSLADYPAPTWALKYRFKNAAGGFEVTATASGSDHAVTITAATSAAYVPGAYDWVAWVESGSEKYTVNTGRLTVLADFRAGTATVALDARSDARKTVEAIRAVIGKTATIEQKQYQVLGRSLERRTVPELLKLLGYFEVEVAREEAAAKMANGNAPGGKMQFRL